MANGQWQMANSWLPIEDNGIWSRKWWREKDEREVDIDDYEDDDDDDDDDDEDEYDNDDDGIKRELRSNTAYANGRGQWPMEMMDDGFATD